MLLPLFISFFSFCSEAEPKKDSIKYSLHFQQTVVSQWHPDFQAEYTGPNSLQPSESIKTSITSTFFGAIKLFPNTEVIFNPELAGGAGMSGAKGIAGFSNGETFRIGNPAPQIYVARVLVSQKIPLSHEREWQDDDVNQVQGYTPLSYIHIVAGRFAISDYFDCNSYSHDPRSQFLNWSLMNNGGYDYAANTRGYTWGGVVEYISTTWCARFGAVMVPTEANLSVMDGNIKDAHALQFELERRFGKKDREGAIRFLVYQNAARMGNYSLAISEMPVNPDIISTRAYGRTKTGFGINAEKKVSDHLGVFARGSWNDGKNETWMFTEIDQSFSFGFVTDKLISKRTGDAFGVAFVNNGISKDHRNYLQAGGTGFMIGDGNLNYGTEMIIESYYRLLAFKENIFITPDYQFVLHPAYNKDRGPVHCLAIRVQAVF